MREYVGKGATIEEAIEKDFKNWLPQESKLRLKYWKAQRNVFWNYQHKCGCATSVKEIRERHPSETEGDWCGSEWSGRLHSLSLEEAPVVL